VYDNASGDETATVVRRLAEADPRVKYHRHAENIGSFKNFVYGVEHVETPFFSLLSDDDLLLPDMYQVALAGFNEFPEAVISITGTIHVDEQARRVLSVPILSWRPGLHTPPEGMLALLEDPQPAVWTGMLFRREVLEKVGNFDEEARNDFDLDFELRIAAHFPIVVSLKPVAIHVIHSGCQNITSTFEQRYGGWPRIIRKITSDEAIPYYARRQAADILKERLKTWLSEVLPRFIVRGEWENLDKAVEMLQKYCHPTLQSSLLRVLARTCRSVPPVHVLLKGVRALRRFVFSLVPVSGGKELQSRYGAYVRYLDF
jgi:GT2 family glycosyltransferase